MTIASEITRINNNIASAYTALSDKGATLPATQNSANLVNTIGSLPTFYSNFIRCGDGVVSVNITTGVVSGFTTGNGQMPAYIMIPQELPIRPSSFERQVCFTTGNNVTSTQFIECDYQFNGATWGISPNSKLIAYVGSCTQPDTWDIINGTEGTTTLQANTKYWVKFIFDGSYYKFYLSTTGAFAGEETTEISVMSSRTIAGDCGTYFGLQKLSYGDRYYLAFEGQINLADCYIKMNGSPWWRADA